MAQRDTQPLPDSLVNLLDENDKHDLQRLKSLNTIVEVLFETFRHNEATPYINEMEILATSLNNNYFTSLSYYYSGVCLCKQNDFKNGFVKLNEANNMTKILPEDQATMLLKIKINIARSACFVQCNMLSDAYNQLQEGLALNENFGNEDLKIKLENNLAAVYSKIGKMEESNAIYRELLKKANLFKKGGYYCNYNIANNFINMSQPDSALIYLNIAQQNTENDEDNFCIAKKIGDVYRLKNDTEASAKHYKKLLDDMDDKGTYLPDIYASTALELAFIYEQNGHLDSCIYFADRSIAASKDCYNIEIEHNALRIKVEILEKARQTEAAFNTLKESIAIQDSLYKIKNIDKLNELMLQHEIIAIEKEYRHQQFIAELEQSKMRMRLMLVIAVLTGAVLIVLLLLNRKRILLKNKQIKEKAMTLELDARNRELASNVITLMKKNEIFTEIINKLLTIKENAVKDETKDAIDKVTKEIEKTMEGKLLEDFEVRFKQVHGDFYERLTQKYPNLSNNEIRLCSFLKLNLTTKEISSLTGQSPDAILKARYRLRKKMKIDDDSINLSNFIMNL